MDDALPGRAAAGESVGDAEHDEAQGQREGRDADGFDGDGDFGRGHAGKVKRQGPTSARTALPCAGAGKLFTSFPGAVITVSNAACFQ